MCGICGYVGDHAPELIEPMCRSMVHRGPDDMGTWHDKVGQVGLGHRRLSIIDLSPAGRQPMCNEDRTIWVSYNGEIYNYAAHRAALIARGHQFRSHSDTEVLIHLYEEKGVDFLQDLNGIFGLALWDAGRRQLLLARDHAGVKPVYYWQDGRRLFFASEVKALLQVPGIPRELNHDAVSDYLTFLWVPGEQTMFRSIRKVKPGHFLLWRDGHVETHRWFRLIYEPEASVSESEWIERVHDTFMCTTRRQMVSDVPLGAFLSGGLDSSSIVACMRQAFPDREIRCYTTSFEQEDLVRDQFVDDYVYAKGVADTLGIQLRSFVLKPDIVSLLPRMVYHLDEPDADPAVFPSYLISKLAREDGTVVLLSGTGGDEVFFGYRSHQAYREYQRCGRLPRCLSVPALAVAQTLCAGFMGAQSKVARRLRKFRLALMKNGLERHIALTDWSSPTTRQRLSQGLCHRDEPSEAMREYYEAFEGRGDLNLHSHMLIQTFLSDHNFLYTDKSSMATSIEVRVPFVDVELMRLCARIPEDIKLRRGITKYPLKKAMERNLPNWVLYRSKTGFGAPLRKWLAEDLKPLVAELLSPTQLRKRGLFDLEAVQEILRENETNRADHTYLIYALLTLEVWQQTFIDRPAEVVSC